MLLAKYSVIIIVIPRYITENAQAQEMRIDGRAFYLVNDLNEPPTGQIRARERLVPKTLVFGSPFLHRREQTHREEVRMLFFQGRSCYWQKILLLLYPAITENTQAHEIHIDGRAFYLVNDLIESPTGSRSAPAN